MPRHRLWVAFFGCMIGFLPIAAESSGSRRRRRSPPHEVSDNTTTTAAATTTTTITTPTADSAEEDGIVAYEIVRGLAEGFLGEHISEDDRSCLSSGAGQMADGIVDTATRAVTKLRRLFGNAEGMSDGMPSSTSLSPSGKTTAALPGDSVPMPVLQTTEAAITTVELARLTAIQLTHTITSMLGFEHQLAAHCLNNETQATFDIAKANAADPIFVGRHLVANGVDVIDYLAEALVAYDKKDYNNFGSDVGRVWRKVLLSKGSSSSELAVHVKKMLKELQPSQLMKEMKAETMEKVLQGFVGKLFGSGFSVQSMAPSENTTTMPWQAAWTAPEGAPEGMVQFGFPEQSATYGSVPPTEIDVDLHACIGGNMQLFSNAWEPVVGLGEQFLEGHCSGAVGALCMSLWTVVLTDVQQALTTCGFTPEQEEVLIHSMWAGQSVSANMSLPNDQVTVKDVTKTMASAVEDWKEERYTKFGEDLGLLCRETVVVSFPQKWALDSDGRLFKRLQAAGVSGFVSASTQGLFCLLLLTAISVAVRRIWIQGRGIRPQAFEMSLDTDDDVEALE